MVDRTLKRFEQRRIAVDYASSAAVVAMWGMGLWIAAVLIAS